MTQDVTHSPLDFSPEIDGRMKEYANARGLSYWQAWDLPPATQLLRHGVQATRNVLMGGLPGGLEGHLAHFGYLVAKGGDFERHRFTAALAALPASATWASRILCHDRDLATSEIDNPEASREVIRLADASIRLESDAFDRRYSLARDHDQDENHVWQLFAPSFVEWLVNSPIAGLSFELQDGALCVFVPEILDDPSALDDFCIASGEVAHRIETESLEEDGLGRSAAGQPDQRETQIRDELSRVTWTAPPESPKSAAKRLRRGPFLSQHAWDLGCEAFFREFLAARGWRRESLGAFRALHLAGNDGQGIGAQPEQLTLPGSVTDVGVGELVEGPEVRIVLTDLEEGDGTRGWNALLLDVESDAPWAARFPDVSPEAGAVALDVRSNGRTVCVFRQSKGRSRRSRAELEEFLGDALREAIRIAGLGVTRSGEAPGR